jgi:hypothetical protein
VHGTHLKEKIGRRKFMNPTLTKNSSGKQFPLIDYNYHSMSLDGCNGRCVRLPSLRNISREYFDKEAHRSFAAEAVLFGAMIVTAAVPIVSGAHAIIELCRTIAI